MKKIYYVVLLFSSLCYGCIRDNVDNNVEQSKESTTSSLSSVITRSSDEIIVDSLVVMRIQQSDHDNLMMSRILFKNNKYELCIKREDAIYFGIDNDLYDEYVSYVERLNAALTL